MKNFLKMNIALFTSNHLRHKYIANEIAKTLSLKLIVCEEKNEAIQETSSFIDADAKVLENHFTNRRASELVFFENCQDFPQDVELVEINYGEINSQKSLNLLEKSEIDFILLFGTSIIKPIILEKFPNRVINLHLGLSPYYKGSGTNFFPIFNNEFESIGATIHLAADKVDSGAILHQFRPDCIDENDSIHSIGNKVIQKAGFIFPKIVDQYLLGKIILHPQKECEITKEFRLKDFTPYSVRKANEIIRDGGILDYLKNKAQRQALKPIVSNYEE